MRVIGGAGSFARLSKALWVVPLLCVLAGVALSFITIAIDKRYDYQLVPEHVSGGPEAAIQILGAVATSMVSLAALVLTITMVVVQLAMGQFSPRIVQRILQDKPSQLAIGVFVGTFAHAVLALREVQTGPNGVVPGLAVILAFVLVIISIMVLVWYVNHIGRKLRVSALIELVGNDTRALLNNLYPEKTKSEYARPSIILAPQSGVVVQVDYPALVRIAQASDCVLRLRPALGEFVPGGASLFEVEGKAEALDAAAAIRCVNVGLERTLDQDMAFGLRMLVDIAERSLSDGPFLDPTTAVQAIDRLHDCLRQLAMREFPDGRHTDEGGRVRLITPVMTWEDHVHLAFDEIRMVGASSPQVARRLRAALEDLLTVTPPERRRVLHEQLKLLKEGVAGSLASGDRAIASHADARGMG